MCQARRITSKKSQGYIAAKGALTKWKDFILKLHKLFFLHFYYGVLFSYWGGGGRFYSESEKNILKMLLKTRYQSLYSSSSEESPHFLCMHS